MAVTLSGLYVTTHINVLKGAYTPVFNYDSETMFKVAMFTNTITPNYSTDTAYAVAPYNANEVSGTGYTAGGQGLTSTTVTESPTGTIMFDAADSSWAASTITNARCALVYADTITTPTAKPACILVNFGADYSTSNGTFTIQWSASGLFTWDVTP